jgi:transcription elongation GreA/GreB family factor
MHRSGSGQDLMGKKAGQQWKGKLAGSPAQYHIISVS